MGRKLDAMSWAVVDEDKRQKICALVNTDLERATRDARVLLDWVNQQPHLPDLDDDELPFLTYYLIGKKNSMEKAKKGLDLYYTSRTAYPDLFGSYQYTEEDMRKLSRHETLNSAPELTPELRRVVLVRLEDCGANFDEVSVLTELKLALVKADICSRLDWFSSMEIVVDISAFSYHYAKRIVSEVNLYRVYTQLALSALPLRVKHIHIVHPPPIFSKTLPIVMSLFKEKMRKRIVLHDSVESLHKHIPPKYLPKELGGELPSCIQTEEERRPYFLTPKTLEFCAYQRTLRSNESKRPGGPSSVVNESFGCEGSFRKLALD